MVAWGVRPETWGRDGHETLVERLKRLYLSDADEGGDEGWNGLRALVLEEALERQVRRGVGWTGCCSCA